MTPVLNLKFLLLLIVFLAITIQVDAGTVTYLPGAKGRCAKSTQTSHRAPDRIEWENYWVDQSSPNWNLGKQDIVVFLNELKSTGLKLPAKLKFLSTDRFSKLPVHGPIGRDWPSWNFWMHNNIDTYYERDYLMNIYHLSLVIFDTSVANRSESYQSWKEDRRNCIGGECTTKMLGLYSQTLSRRDSSIEPSGDLKSIDISKGGRQLLAEVWGALVFEYAVVFSKLTSLYFTEHQANPTSHLTDVSATPGSSPASLFKDLGPSYRSDLDAIVYPIWKDVQAKQLTPARASEITFEVLFENMTERSNEELGTLQTSPSRVNEIIAAFRTQLAE